MYIYKISQNVNNDYDSYDSAVVAAESEEQEHKETCPQHYTKWQWTEDDCPSALVDLLTAEVSVQQDLLHNKTH